MFRHHTTLTVTVTVVNKGSFLSNWNTMLLKTVWGQCNEEKITVSITFYASLCIFLALLYNYNLNFLLQSSLFSVI